MSHDSKNRISHSNINLVKVYRLPEISNPTIQSGMPETMNEANKPDNVVGMKDVAWEDYQKRKREQDFLDWYYKTYGKSS
jgi:hypothetical protein|tara:strand:- start:128 stop:367 length:240 start_codon:yes stop_codon:yes gene_type:complete